ncbi:MAG: hypothetical protein SCALA702_11800 [Melioribacteraceae bacterium]|nr:MAG: hypothetical protein SCALA702_11800 [Melioribacteraceae bacterium]
MKSITVLILLLLFAAQSLYGQDFYDIENINTIEITFSESNWDQILDNLYAAGDEDRLVGSALINGEQYDSVGVRYKGNSTYNPNQTKNPLNIKLDHIIDDQKLDGYGTLKLANVYKDPSFVREVLSYEIARKYMPASKANYIKVSINGTYLGLYTSVQSVDKFFMANNFYSNDFPRFKGELTNDSPQNQVTVWGYLGDDSTSYYDYYELKSDYGWAELIEFLDVLNNNSATVEEVLDVDRHLWMLAFDNLLVNLDSPINFGHNYYLYRDGTERFNPIIWDLNESFGGFSMLLSGPPLNTTQLQQLSPLLHLTHSDYPIINKILSNPTFEKIYIAHMKTILEENFSNGAYESRALEIQDIIDSEVQADPYKFYTYNDFINNLNSSVGFGPQSVVGITQLMDARANYLNNLASFQSSAPEISNISTTPAAATANSDVWITAQANNATTVKLAYRFITTAKFQKIDMFDDGNHNDGAAGDGIYGTLVALGSTDMQYYIYAENDDAVKFSPERAEYEFYNIAVNNQIVINEFMADNDNIVQDPEGEFDDWIELYNNSDTPVSLNGYYLTDESDELTQWVFPDVSIGAQSYLIIWADDDEDQEGLHANFKLSASGEEILLVAPDTTIVDQVSFGAQETDISMGRFPNGTGPFEMMTPTFGLENQISGNLNSEIIVDEGWNILSMPVHADDMMVSSVFPDAASPAYAFDGGYVTADEFMMGEGYWLKFDEAGSHEMMGQAVSMAVGVDQGWNIVGPFDQPVTTSEITSNPAGILASVFYGFDNGYSIAEELTPGKGYWIKTSTSGLIMLPMPVVGKKGEEVNSPNADALYTISVATADGAAGSYGLMLGIDPAATDGIDSDLGETELPPLPPAGVYDARMILPDGTTGSPADYRTGDNNYTGQVTYTLKYQLGDGGASMTLDVDIPEIPGTVTMTVQDPFGGVLVNEVVNEGGGQVVVTNTSLTELKLIVDYNAPIPVELSSFAANVVGETIQLAWETATETNNKGFEVERSEDNAKFTKVGYIDGNGTTSEKQSYTFTDHHAVSGTYYYRLRQVDFDGTSSYSDAVEVDFVPTEYSLGQNYPNPFNPSTRIKFAVPVDSKVTVTLYNMLGQKVQDIVSQNYSVGLHEVDFNASELSSGMYIYSITAQGVDGSNFVDTKKMMLMK